MGMGHKNNRIGELNSFWLFSLLFILFVYMNATKIFLILGRPLVKYIFVF